MITHAKLKKDPLYKQAVKNFLEGHLEQLELELLQLHACRDLKKIINDYMRFGKKDRLIKGKLLEGTIGVSLEDRLFPALHRRCGWPRTP